MPTLMKAQTNNFVSEHKNNKQDSYRLFIINIACCELLLSGGSFIHQCNIQNILNKFIKYFISTRAYDVVF